MKAVINLLAMSILTVLSVMFLEAKDGDEDKGRSGMVLSMILTMAVTMV